jgi:hypothetical protein
MSDPTSNTLPKIHIKKTGQKFPPFKYDADTTPDSEVVAAVRRNGQLSYSRRILRPTLVLQQLEPMSSLLAFLTHSSPSHPFSFAPVLVHPAPVPHSCILYSALVSSL